MQQAQATSIQEKCLIEELSNQKRCAFPTAAKDGQLMLTAINLIP